jgi:hypothetical protein
MPPKGYKPPFPLERAWAQPMPALALSPALVPQRYAQLRYLSIEQREPYLAALRSFTRLADGHGRPITWAHVADACDEVNPLLTPGQRLSDDDLHRILLLLRQALAATQRPLYRTNGSVVTCGIPTVG